MLHTWSKTTLSVPALDDYNIFPAAALCRTVASYLNSLSVILWDCVKIPQYALVVCNNATKLCHLAVLALTL